MIEAIGFTHARTRMREIGRRMSTPARALAPELLALEAEERAIFEELHGRFVDTGRAERSLTESGGGDAVRRVHGTFLEFGTDVDYVRYLTANMEGGHHSGRNEVLISSFEVKEGQAPERILKRMVGE